MSWPGAARLRRALGYAPTRRLAAAVAAVAPLWLLSGWTAGAALAAAATGGVLLAVLVDLALQPSDTDVDVSREVPESLGVGDRATAGYHVRSRWGRPLFVTVYDELPKYVVAEREPVEMALPARGTVELAYEVYGCVRGDGALGDIALRVRTPLGLVTRTLRYAPTDRVMVACATVAGAARGAASHDCATTSWATTLVTSTGRRRHVGAIRSRASSRSSSHRPYT